MVTLKKPLSSQFKRDFTMAVSQRYLSQLHQMLDAYVSEDDIKTFCFDAEIKYANIAGRTLNAKIRELLQHLNTHNRITELDIWFGKLLPMHTWTFQANLFISYKRHAAADESLARYLHQTLSAEGHHVFIDQTMRAGEAWLEEIDHQIRQSDYLIVLLSKASADSEMVQAEVRRAHAYKQQQGYPVILPIRVNYEQMLPYAIDAFVSQIQYINWASTTDNHLVVEEILQIIQGQLVDKPPILVDPNATLSEDGSPVSNDEPDIVKPLPEFDPRILETMLEPGGAVRLRDQLYVARDGDEKLRRGNHDVRQYRHDPCPASNRKDLSADARVAACTPE